MDGKSFTIKPIYWRLLLWRTLPFYIGFIIGGYISKLPYGYSGFYFLYSGIGAAIGGLIVSSFLREHYDIVISEEIISGPGTSLIIGRESFPISKMDKSSIHKKQSFYERVSWFRTLHSVTGQKIMLAPFIYGKSATQELYRILEK